MAKRLEDITSEYSKLASNLCEQEGVTQGQMFGKLCLKVKGKAFLAMHDNFIIFKLNSPIREKALALLSSSLWDPSGKGRPMKEWIALEISQKKYFDTFAKSALEYVSLSLSER